jgi:hypothetical protein
MKRYLNFAGDDYYPKGGWYDAGESHDNLQDAIEQAYNNEWWHVVDLETGKIVASSYPEDMDNSASPFAGE